MSPGGAGRAGKGIAEGERETVIEVHRRYGIGASYIRRILREGGLAVSEPRRWHRRKWIRYERDHSNSLWHVDWHGIKDPRWKGMWLIAYEDDSSRFIVGYGVYPTLTSKYSVEVLRRAISEHGRPEEILSDHGSTFYAVEADGRERGLTAHRVRGVPAQGEDGIRLIVGRVDHPQTNGKIEKFFDTFERNVGNFEAIDEFMVWYNYVRPHGAFEVGKLETPGIMYYRRLPEKGRMALVDPSLLSRWREGGETICR